MKQTVSVSVLALRHSNRPAKHNQLLRIEQLLGKNAVYAGKNALTKARRWFCGCACKNAAN